jgi:3-dehydroquinate synthase
MTNDVTVDLGERSYPIHIGSGVLDTLGEACKAAGLKGRCLLVSDENVAPLYAENVFQSLEKAGFAPTLEVLPAGEPTKCHEQLIRLYSKAAELSLDRGHFMVALGGGVIGDLTGYAAASWLRGIKFVQVPTSLLAMVDSSVGGKTGINIAEGKNLVGAFHQPELVLIDLDTLKTLPERELAAGMAEVVKYGVIWDTVLFEELESVDATSSSRSLPKIISRCCEIKAEVVRQDEREGGLRGILNFGHTLAHAIENVAGYGEYLHGEAVAIGMIYAARLSTQLKGFSVEESARIEKLLATLGLPVDALYPQGLRRDKLAWNDLRAAMAVDKKTRDGLVKFVLVDRMGHAEIGCEIPEEILEKVWNGMDILPANE